MHCVGLAAVPPPLPLPPHAAISTATRLNRAKTARSFFTVVIISSPMLFPLDLLGFDAYTLSKRGDRCQGLCSTPECTERNYHRPQTLPITSFEYYRLAG